MNELGSKLPAGMADPLHIFPQWTSAAVGILLGLIITAIAVALLVYWLRKSRESKPPQTWTTPEVPRTGGFAALVEGIRREYEASEDYRAGCHALSAALKAHLEKRTGLEVEEMTAREIGLHFPEETRKFFARLSHLQFGINEPDRKDFTKACRDSRPVAKIGARRGRAAS